jgi:hypothetical protein
MYQQIHPLILRELRHLKKYSSRSKVKRGDLNGLNLIDPKRTPPLHSFVILVAQFNLSPDALAGRKPLYRKESYAGQDMEKVLGEGIRAEDINDDALGRALVLDRMAQADLKALWK